MSFATSRVFLLNVIAIISCSLLPGCGVPGPDGPADSFGLDFTPADDMEVRGAVIFIVDGVNGTLFQQMLEAGELPAMKKYFMDRGLYSPRTVANIPSVTLANLTSIATGRFPGHHGVTGVTWFDRHEFIYRDYAMLSQKNTLGGDYSCPNIYELANNPGHDFMVSIFFQPHRGTTKFFENALSGVAPYVFGWYLFLDRLTLFRFGEMMDLARKNGRFPLVTCAYLLSPDFQAYAHGMSSPQYREALLHTDRQIGRVLGDMASAGVLDKIVIALISDHSMGDVGTHFEIGKFLRNKAGLNLAREIHWEESSASYREEYYNEFPAVLYRCGDRYAALCLREPITDSEGKVTGYKPWSVRPRPEHLQELIQKLSAQQAVDVVAWSTGENRCRVRTRRGVVEFSQPSGPGGDILYTLVSNSSDLLGTDPLGWTGQVPSDLLNGKPASPRCWLDVTNATTYPDLPAQILAYFRAPRAGDIALFASPGYDFFTKNRAGHGGVRGYEDLHVPLLIAGPGVPHKRISAARTADLVPTILQLLGKDKSKKHPHNFDGQSLIPKP